MTETRDLLAFAETLAAAAADEILPRFRTPMAIDDKGSDAGRADDPRRYDPVTEADRAAEQAMRRLIEAQHPDHGIVGEEFGIVRDRAHHVWVLDPVDGTRSFIAGIPLWGTLIGLLADEDPSVGLMAQPFIGETFSGDGASARYRGPRGERPLRTRACPSLAEATLFTTTPALFDARERAAYDALERQVRLPRYGTDCYGYCMLAAGHADIVVEAGLQAYDIVALIPIVEGAGGIVTTWDGGSPTRGGRIVASGDPRLHEQALKILGAV